MIIIINSNDGNHCPATSAYIYTGAVIRLSHTCFFAYDLHSDIPLNFCKLE